MPRNHLKMLNLEAFIALMSDMGVEVVASPGCGPTAQAERGYPAGDSDRECIEEPCGP